MKKPYLIIIITAVIFAGFYAVVFWYSHSGFASTINQSYKGNITNGLVGWWTSDGSSTSTVARDRGGTNNGTLSTTGISPVAGKLGQGLNFNGISGKITLGSVTAGTNITVSAWVRTSSVAQRPIFSNRAASNLYFGITGGKAFVYDGASCAPSSSRFINNNDFHHILWTNNGTASTFYIDGVLDSSPACTRSPSTATGYIGWDSPNNEWFPGTIDDLRIYNRVLSAKEVAQLYQMSIGSAVNKTPVSYGLASNKANLVGWWTFDAKDLTTTVATDRSGQNNNGTRYDITTPMAGKIGQGLGFDGASSTVQVADSASLDVTDNFTLSAWAKINESSHVNSIISKGSYSLKIGADERPYFEILRGTENIADTGALSTSTRVYSFAVWNGKLYAGTYVSSEVFRYDGGTTWTSVGVLKNNNAAVYSLAVYNGRLYGSITTSSGAKIYRYDGGTLWTDVGAAGTCAFNAALVVYNNNLYTGCGSTPFNVYRYDGGTTWTDSGSLAGAAYSFAVYGGKLYVGTNNAGNVYRYDGGTTWTGVGAVGTGSIAMSLVIYNGSLYSAAFSEGNVYRYDGGTTWTSVGALGNSTALRSLVVYNGKLYGAGIDATTPSSLYRYDGGTTWTSIGQFCPTCSSSRTLIVYDGKLYGGTWDNGNVYSMGSGEALYGGTALTGFNHLAGTYDGSTMKLFVNGSLNASYTTSTTVATNTLPLLIGSSFGSSGAGIGEENLNGIIDDARVYNTALTEEQIFELSKSGVNTVNKTPGTVASSTAQLASASANGLVGWWTFDGSATGTAKDMSGNGNHGVWSVTSTSAVPGRLGQALKFDVPVAGAGGGYVSLGVDKPFGGTVPSGTTLAFWVKKSYSAANQTVAIFSEYSEGCTDALFYISYATGYDRLNWKTGDTTYGGNLFQGLSDGNWHHIAMTRYPSATSRYYFDGRINSQWGVSIPWQDDCDLDAKIGPAQYAMSSSVGVSVDDLRIYNRGLSTQEINQLYRMGK